MKHLFSMQLALAIEAMLMLLLLLIFNGYCSVLWSILFFLLFMGFNLMLLAQGLIRWNRNVWIALASITLMILLFPGLIALPKTQNASFNNGTRIMSYNLNYLRSILVPNENKEDWSFNHFIDFMKNENPIDILCVQETSSASYVPIAKQLDYPHYYGRRGTMIFARQPFIDKGYIDFREETDNSCTWATITINQKLYRVYNAHLESYNFSQIFEEINTEVGCFQKLKKISQAVNHISQLRMQQAEKIAQHISECPYPIILCGDFNDLPISPIYQFFSQHFNDAFRQGGTGFGQTFKKIAGLRIDYFFTEPSIPVLDYKRIKTDFSDHYPILLNVKL